MFESRKFEKIKGSNIVKCVQKISYIIDQIVSLKRNFSKGLVISNFLASLLYKYMKFGISMANTEANSLGTSEISYNIFDLRHVIKEPIHF